jgi:AhpD family alkylhydroperoxidase
MLRADNRSKSRRDVMPRTVHGLRAAGLGVFIAGAMLAGPAMAQDAPAAYRDIQATLGSVPTFFKLFPEEGIAGAWNEFKTVQLNPHSALPGKVKELIGLAVAAQIPCSYCIYFHTEAAKLNGASDAEIREAVAMAAITRHWSKVLNGMQADQATFRQETDTVLRLAATRMKPASPSQ